MNTLLGIFAGFLLAWMIFFNGGLASFVGPVEGSFLVHAIGLTTALLILPLGSRDQKKLNLNIPKYSYIGGIFGGVIVIVVGVTANSVIGVSGTVAMILLGQILFGWFADLTGFLGLEKRKVTLTDFLQVALVLAGSGVLLYA